MYVYAAMVHAVIDGNAMLGFQGLTDRVGWVVLLEHSYHYHYHYYYYYYYYYYYHYYHYYCLYIPHHYDDCMDT